MFCCGLSASVPVPLQVLHFFCDTCSVPVCREASVGCHSGHSLLYLQDSLQDSRTLTIQLLADAQRGRHAVQVGTGMQGRHAV